MNRHEFGEGEEGDGSGAGIPDGGNSTCKGLEEEKCFENNEGKDRYGVDHRKAVREQSQRA